MLTKWAELRAVLPEEITKILEVTDSLSLHREKIVIPLQTVESGAATLQSDGRIRITCPRTGPTEEWLQKLRNMLGGLTSVS